jgi:pimeloyl-ACP methyl ester carboxylesterase
VTKQLEVSAGSVPEVIVEGPGCWPSLRGLSLVLVATLALASRSAIPASDSKRPSAPVGAEGYFFAGGGYFKTADGEYMSGQMYVEYKIPLHRRYRYPIVLFSGAGQSGLNYTGTPDGREGWAQYFLRQGYAVYLLDQPSRARSPHAPEDGDLSRLSSKFVQALFTAPEHSNLWPQAHLHTQWPGTGLPGDPVFDQFFAQIQPSLTSTTKQQELNRAAGIELLDRIGPAILLAHSQSGLFAWLIADSRPALVKAIIAAEPSGPPVHENIPIGSPDWFKDGPLTKPYGLTSLPLGYEPPVADPTELSFTQEAQADAPGLVRCWLQSDPARRLQNLRHIPVLILQAEASYHAAYDHCTVKYLRQAGVQTDFIPLTDVGIHGNGHMLMFEKNNSQIAAVIVKWLRAQKSLRP